jgi:hypothetical protein
MKLIIIVNNITDTFETCILSRDLATDEIMTIHELMGHGEHRSVHIAECGDKAIPFLDIMEALTKIAPNNIPHETSSNQPGHLHSLRGLPTKYFNKLK